VQAEVEEAVGLLVGPTGFPEVADPSRFLARPAAGEIGFDDRVRQLADPAHRGGQVVGGRGKRARGW
jgi:hypothetical protein